MKNKDVERDVKTNLTLSQTTLNALSITTSSLSFGGMLQFGLGEAICFTTTTVEMWITQGTSEIALKEESDL